MKVRALNFPANRPCTRSGGAVLYGLSKCFRSAATATFAMLLQNPKMAKNKLDGDLDDYFKVSSLGLLLLH